MKKRTKIILAIVIILILILGGALVYKLSWFGAGMKPTASYYKETPTVAQADAMKTDDDDSLQAEDSRAIYELQQFPESGNEVKDFVVGHYEITMEDEGFLDDDNLKDVVLVLQNKYDSTDVRPTLVLLKQQTGGYKLYGVSKSTVGPAYENDYQMYIQESVEIDSNKLTIKLNGYGGPTGNQFNTYKFIDGKLQLIHVYLYNAGAGGQTYLDVDYLKNTVRQEDVNTMLDSMPSTITIKKIPKHKPYYFEKDEGLDVNLSTFE